MRMKRRATTNNSSVTTSSANSSNANTAGRRRTTVNVTNDSQQAKSQCRTCSKSRPCPPASSAADNGKNKDATAMLLAQSLQHTSLRGATV
eukprot:CAMPEP_0171357666 /NCGR_PEP_ID=MMETSP0878-20121228/46359_1 /TAXON_ID=67004 /ORGANISM="Thalassiosira weissflogii, Strain CCMP1336" /LENGTH=90 /DNA_ID=CAMNT_0011863713 /DNA_START=116 /DNA_END=388 /DNA_ORIENTATION=+